MRFYALRGFCYFPCRRGGGMINFWGDFTFFLFSLPTLPGCPRAPRSLWGAFFIFGVFLEKWSMVIENDCARPFLSFHRARGRARTPRPKGAARPAVFVGTWAKSSKGGVRPQHFSKPGSNDRDVPRDLGGAGVCLVKEDSTKDFLGAQPLTRSWTYRQARAASPEPASLSWAGHPNAECGRQSTAENLLGGKYIE